ncbi:hypothetical protein J2X46_003155 [Nocardioides sp. BE266]|uniref:hypothetical protein n=1 Tax=Nocardioides sp. BE266 TaxID=2817725 RepID=UPI002855A23D|nr:hypothetical protein [Nocardioides sp. BE266]MDR7254162.1 hypothetical protein [Nocardioides sp. BE266]
MKLLLHLHTQLYLWLHMLNARATSLDRASTSDVAAPRHAGRRRTDRGSVTIEQVIWAGAVIVIVGIVVAAITGYVTTQADKIK